jgi:serine protease Do
VKLNNGSFFPVEGILADDSDRDIAVIKVRGKNLPVLTIADSDLLAAGDHVVAIGSPLGLENSVSDGIISGFREDEKGRSWVQTTAPISHGNSGGPLLTMDEK